MKKVLFVFTLLFGCFGLPYVNAVNLEPKVDKKSQERIIITTDLEVDDMNGIILSLMYADQYDLAGIVWTAGMFHFSGDLGKHTLAEITPNYRCNAQHCEHTVANAGELRSYRPADPTFLDRMLNCYEVDYKNLSKNSPNYPTPDYLRSITKVGNIEFEGDYRFETEGSKLIEELIMDDDMRPLHIQHWGGINTTVRALYSIYEKYHGTADWPKVLEKVVAKVRLAGSGEDNCRADSKIDEMFPGLQNDNRARISSYGQFFSAKTAAPEVLPYYQSDYLCDAFKFNHGKLLSEFWLMGEGRAVFGEPLIYNYGLITYMDWGLSAKLGWGPENLSSRPRYEFDPFDWMCCQFGCSGYIDFGIRQGMNHMNNRYTQVYFDELAARADWALGGPENCNHAPIVKAETLDFKVKPGKSVTLTASAVDPDGNEMSVNWWVEPAMAKDANPFTAQAPYGGDKVLGSCLSVQSEQPYVAGTPYTVTFTVPKTAQIGDRIVVNMEVTDKAERPMHRYAQFYIDVVKK